MRPREELPQKKTVTLPFLCSLILVNTLFQLGRPAFVLDFSPVTRSRFSCKTKLGLARKITFAQFVARARGPVVGGDSEERGDVRDSQCGATPPNNNKMLPCAQFFSHRIYLAFFRLHLYINISFFCVVLGLEQSMRIPHVRFYAVMRLCDLDIHYALLLSESAWFLCGFMRTCANISAYIFPIRILYYIDRINHTYAFFPHTVCVFSMQFHALCAYQCA